MIKDIGDTIRRRRQNAGWTLRELGSRCDLSTAFLSQVERGKASPSIVALAGICRALGLSLRDVIVKEPDIPRAHIQFITRSETQLHFQIGNRSVDYTYLAGAFPMRDVDLLISSLPPGHFYDSEAHSGEEFGYILKGAITLTIEHEEFILNPGDSYHFPSDRKHSYATPRNEGAEVLWGTTGNALGESCHIFQGKTYGLPLHADYRGEQVDNY